MNMMVSPVCFVGRPRRRRNTRRRCTTRSRAAGARRSRPRAPSTAPTVQVRWRRAVGGPVRPIAISIAAISTRQSRRATSDGRLVVPAATTTKIRTADNVGGCHRRRGEHRRWSVPRRRTIIAETVRGGGGKVRVIVGCGPGTRKKKFVNTSRHFI